MEVKRMAGWALGVCVRSEQGPEWMISWRPGQVASRISRRGERVRGKAVMRGVSMPGFWVPWPGEVSLVSCWWECEIHTWEEECCFWTL